MNYYSEWEPFAADWLRGLCAAGAIPPGVVDSSDIREMRADGLRGFTQWHLFAGLGGWSAALALAGWPRERSILTVSCPCQPFSAAGKGKGEEDERHLWPVAFALIRQLRPDCIIGEQVGGSAGYQWLDGVRTDLESEGYSFGAADLPAACVNAPHIRSRLFWCAIRLGDSGSPASQRHPGGFSASENRGEQERFVDGGVPVGSPDAGDCLSGRLADVPSSGRREEYQERSGSRGRDTSQGRRRGSSDHGDDGGLADRSGEGRRRARSASQACDGSENEPRRLRAISRMADADRGGCGREGLRLSERRPLEAIPDVAGAGEDMRTGGVGNTSEPGLQGSGVRGCGRTDEGLARPAGGQPAGRGFWDDYRVIACRDGKTRRVAPQPELFPLAHGISRAGMVEFLAWLARRGVPEKVARGILRRASANRTGRLKAAGNAIVPEVAAVFIRAVMDELGIEPEKTMSEAYRKRLHELADAVADAQEDERLAESNCKYAQQELDKARNLAAAVSERRKSAQTRLNEYIADAGDAPLFDHPAEPVEPVAEIEPPRPKRERKKKKAASVVAAPVVITATCFLCKKVTPILYEVDGKPYCAQCCSELEELLQTLSGAEPIVPHPPYRSHPPCCVCGRCDTEMNLAMPEIERRCYDCASAVDRGTQVWRVGEGRYTYRLYLFRNKVILRAKSGEFGDWLPGIVDADASCPTLEQITEQVGKVVGIAVSNITCFDVPGVGIGFEFDRPEARPSVPAGELFETSGKSKTAQEDRR